LKVTDNYFFLYIQGCW